MLSRGDRSHAPATARDGTMLSRCSYEAARPFQARRRHCFDAGATLRSLRRTCLVREILAVRADEDLQPVAAEGRRGHVVAARDVETDEVRRGGTRGGKGRIIEGGDVGNVQDGQCAPPERGWRGERGASSEEERGQPGALVLQSSDGGIPQLETLAQVEALRRGHASSPFKRAGSRFGVSARVACACACVAEGLQGLRRPSSYLQQRRSDASGDEGSAAPEG